MDIQSFVFGIVTVMVLASVGGVVYAVVKVISLTKLLKVLDTSTYSLHDEVHKHVDSEIEDVRRLIDSRVDKSEQNRKDEYLELKSKISGTRQALLNTDIQGQLPVHWHAED